MRAENSRGSCVPMATRRCRGKRAGGCPAEIGLESCLKRVTASLHYQCRRARAFSAYSRRSECRRSSSSSASNRVYSGAAFLTARAPRAHAASTLIRSTRRTPRGDAFVRERRESCRAGIITRANNVQARRHVCHARD